MDQQGKKRKMKRKRNEIDLSYQNIITQNQTMKYNAGGSVNVTRKNKKTGEFQKLILIMRNICHFNISLISIAKQNNPKCPTSPKFSKPWFENECKVAVRRHRTYLKQRTNQEMNIENYIKTLQQMYAKLLKNPKKIYEENMYKK